MTRLADHVVVLEAGKVLASGPLVEVLARVDTPIRIGEEPGVVLDAVVLSVDPEWNLAQVEFDGGKLWVRDEGVPAGHKARIRILARDVSLAADRPGPSSFQNILEGVVDEAGADSHPALSLVRLRAGRSAILTKLTRRAAAELGVVPGRVFWMQIKSAALVEW